MNKIRTGVFLVFAATLPLLAGPLTNVKTIQLDPTIVPNPGKVKVEAASNLMQDSLHDALQAANFEIGDSPIHAHLVLDKFDSGSTTERVLFGGYGAGRSTLDTHLVVSDGDREVANVRIRVHGNFAFASYEGGGAQSRQAEKSFQKRLLEEINKLK